MKNYYRSILAVVVLATWTSSASAQNIFSQKVEGCDTKRFCLDCGDPKADAASGALDAIVKDLNKSYKFGKAQFAVMFQVLVDSVGQGCVISHTDKSKNLMTKGIIGYLNAAKWVPAVTKDETTMSSINVLFLVADGKISARVERIKSGDVAFK